LRQYSESTNRRDRPAANALATSDPVWTLDLIGAVTGLDRKGKQENVVKRMLVLSLAMIALALGAVWAVSSFDNNTGDRNVPLAPAVVS